jgi:lipoprotein-releasing system permease protein
MYKLHLILKYLLKRRIAWVSLIAVMMCTTMVVVVRSVMGGWLEMFRESFHGLTGDIVIEGHSLSGFPYYQDIIKRVEALPEVESAVPTIYAFGLININNLKTDGVQVIGYPIEKVARINNFANSLHRQNRSLLDEAEKPGVSPARAELLRKMAAMTPSFDLRTYVRVPLDNLPAGVQPPSTDRFKYDDKNRWLQYTGRMGDDERDQLLKASADPTWQEAIRLLFEKTNDDVIDYAFHVPKARGDVTKWPGMIAGVGVLNIRKNREGETINRFPDLYTYPTKLTVMGIQPGSVSVDVQEKAEKMFWVVDDSRTGVWQFDSKSVYVPFDDLQTMLGMDEKTATDKDTGEKVTEPARASDVQVKVKPGVDLQIAKKKIAAVVEEVFKARRAELASYRGEPTVETWEEDKATFISAIENETVLVTFLFGIISIVAVFLIFCIFYMIVVEKTRDIGIIKSVGATAGGVAGIFLGYGLAIGVVGGALGMLVSYLIVHNINFLHTKLAELLGIQIWNPEVYLFDKIPNQINPRDAIVIGVCALIASVAGAVVPAWRAAKLNPVESLRWE